MGTCKYVLILRILFNKIGNVDFIRLSRKLKVIKAFKMESRFGTTLQFILGNSIISSVLMCYYRSCSFTLGSDMIMCTLLGTQVLSSKVSLRAQLTVKPMSTISTAYVYSTLG